MNKLKIGIILTPIYSPNSGGGYSFHTRLLEGIDNYTFNNNLEIVFINLSKNQIQFSHKQCLHFVPFLKPDLSDRIRRIKMGFLRRVPLFKKSLNKLEKLHSFFMHKKIEDFFMHEKIELLYYPFPSYCAYNYPYVVTHWDIGHMSTYSFPEMIMNNSYQERHDFYEKSVKKAFAIFCESEAGKEELVNYYRINSQRIHCIPLFPGEVIACNVHPDLQQACLQKYKLIKSRFFFYPAQFWPHKNHYNLTRAFEVILNAYPDFKLVLSGSDKGNLGYIKEVCENNSALKDTVIFAGFVPTEEVFTLYKNACALIMPTFLGPTNMPLIEAAKLGCPVLTSDLPGHREMLGGYAQYFNPWDYQDIAAKMLHQINNDALPTSFNDTVFNLSNALKSIDEAFEKLIPIRKTWGIDSTDHH